MRKKTVITILFFLLMVSHTAISQKQLNSPYSRFNIGTLESQGSFKNKAMGGVGIAMRDNNAIHYMNPASYSSLDTNSFVFDFGFDFGTSVLKQGDNKYSSNDMNFKHLMMGFPIAKKWGVAVGIVPISRGYYNISNYVSEETDANYDPVRGPYYSSNSGKGGFSNLFLGTGVSILKNLSIGINMTVMFGSLDRSQAIIFEDYDNNFHTSISEGMKINGINFDYGLQYMTKIKDDYFLNVGFTLVSGKSYKSNYEYFAATTSIYHTTYDPYDTLVYISEAAAPVKLPQAYKTGVAFGKPNKYTIGFDVVATPWSKSNIPGFKKYAANTMTYALGIEYIPEKYSNSSILKRTEYRFGAHLGDNYLILDDIQLKEKGVSFGMGIPLRRTISRVNLFIDYTQISASKNSGLHTENTITIGGSLNFYDFWFFKRRYN